MDFEIPEQYEVTERHFMKEQDAEGILLRHKKSGARLFLIPNSDSNKVFNIAFRTPVYDSTGVPHIIEHTVLCGSDRYPARDPFVELVKGSMNTFLNAMTYPDKTMYPVASTNDQDFFNLMSVYMDAVFHPNILKNDRIFMQEGWHYEMETPEDPLVCNGVVYNEMKGAFSSADDVLERYTQQALFPDTTYAYVSGGDPEVIPTLTYEAYLAFYRRYYHPSNSYIYLYGDMDMEKALNWMDKEYLSGYDRIDPKSEIELQAPFREMAELTIPYSVTDSEEEEAGCYFSWNKVIGTNLDKELNLAFQILEYVLLNAPGAPLTEKLLDAGVGCDIYGGFEDGIYQPYFQIIAKDAKEEDRELFVSTIEEVLKDQAEKGISRRALLAAINGLEFRLKEADFGRWPRGLMIGLDCFDSWLYDEGDPFCHLEYQETLDYLRSQIDTGYFETLIQNWLLDNPHGALITAIPKPGLTEEKEKEAAERLQKYKASLSDEEILHIIDEAKALRTYQETPTPQEILEMIPMLKRSDIRREALPLCNEERTAGNAKVLFHALHTAGISYLEPVFSADFLKPEEIPYFALLRKLLGSMDTDRYSYRELTEEINIYTGGIMPGFMMVQPGAETKRPALYFSVRIRCLYENLEKAAELAVNLMLHTDFSDDHRLKEILGEQQSRLKEALLNSGNSTAVRRSSSYQTEASWLGELTGGIAFYQFIDDLYRHYEEKKDALKAKLTEIIKKLFTKEHLLLNYTAEEKGWQLLEAPAGLIWKELGDEKVSKAEWEFQPERLQEGFFGPGQVQFVARTGNFRQAGLPFTGTLRVLQNILNYDYLWKNLREKGGAYGCMSGFSRNGEQYVVSYLDPHLKRSLEVYDGLADYVKNFTVSDRDMTKYIIGTVSEMDIPMNASARGERGLQAWLSDITLDRLQKERDQVLDAAQEDIRALEPYMQALLRDDCFCVVGSEGKLKAAQEIFKSLKRL